jgi:2-aminoadipate transaminase
LQLLHLDWGYVDETLGSGVLAELAAAALREHGPAILQYGDPRGFLPLRSALAERLRAELATPISDEMLCVTNGATAAIDLVARCILQARFDSVVLAPIYDTALAILRMNSRRVFAIPTMPFAPAYLSSSSWALLADALARPRTKLLYVVPTFQNPTGITLPEIDRRRMLELCREHQVTIVEDDPYRSYNFSTTVLPPTMWQLRAAENQIVFIGSLSKLLYPSVRTGYTVSSPQIAQAVAEAQKSTTSSANLIMQAVCAVALADGSLDRIASRHRQRIGEKHQLLFQSFCDTDLERSAMFTRPAGGFFVWCRARLQGIDSSEVVRIAREEGVSVVPGRLYYLDATSEPEFRLSYSHVATPDVGEAATRLAGAVHRLVGANRLVRRDA